MCQLNTLFSSLSCWVLIKGFLVLCVISQLIAPAETQSESNPTQLKLNLVNGSIRIDLEGIQTDKLKLKAKFTRSSTFQFKKTATVSFSVWLLSSNRISVQRQINNLKTWLPYKESVEMEQKVDQMKKTECDAIVVSLEFSIPGENIHDVLFVPITNYSLRMFST